MKTKISIITALLSLITNVALGSGSVSLGYSSDFLRRGAALSEESLQGSVAFSTEAQGLNLSASALTNKPTSAGADSYLLAAGGSKQFSELLNVYVGVEHFENVPGESALDVVAKVGLDVALSPSVYVARNTEESLYTYEVEAGHQLDLGFGCLCLSAVYGNTDTASGDLDYIILGGSMGHSVSENAELIGSVDYVDSDSFEDDVVLGLSLNVSF
tara:strand:- start:2712 stop:3356 length:645 start_codon:yes stop_codon:yes gene_type:complete